MFKTAATKIAHNSTIPALAGNSDLRPLQDLITAEKTVLESLQRLSVGISKASDALRIWGQGEGNDLGDTLTASTTILAHFSAALSTYASLHHTMRDNMKAVRTREEALDDLRRRRKRVGASAEAAEKKLNKMSPEHKNLGAQTDMLNKLRDEMRAMDGEIVREEAQMGDLKRKCAKNWMTLKFGGLVECCEKGVIVGDLGKNIIKEIPEDVTQPGLPRAYYSSHTRVSDYVVETKRAVSQVTFSGSPSGRTYGTSSVQAAGEERVSRSDRRASQGPVASPYLPTPSLGSELTINVGTYGTQPANGRASVEELGVNGTSHVPPAAQFATMPSRERGRAQGANPTRPLSVSGRLGNGRATTEDDQSLMASIADALSQSHRGVASVEQVTSLGHATDEPAPKYEAFGHTVSDGHGYTGNGHTGDVGTRSRRTLRRSTSPPAPLPPGAAPAAIRAWDDGMGQGEDGAHSDRPASSSQRVPSQRRISSSEPDGEEADGSDYDDSGHLQDEAARTGRTHRRAESGGGLSYNEDVNEAMVVSDDTNPSNWPVSSLQRSSSTSTSIQNPNSATVSVNKDVSPNMTPPSRAESQRRIPRVPPPSMDPNPVNVAEHPSSTRAPPQNNVATSVEDDTQTDETAEERARNVAAAREVSRELDALAFNAMSSGGYSLPPAPPVHEPPSYESQEYPNPYQHQVPPIQVPPVLPSQSPYRSSPPSPLAIPNPPFANRAVSPNPPPTLPLALDRPPSEGRSPLNPNMGPLPPHPSPRLAQLDVLSAGCGGSSTSPLSPPYRSPPEYPRPAPPFSSPLMAKSTSSLSNGGSGGGPRTISAAAFRRPQGRTVSSGGSELGPADTSPLMFRRPSPTPVSTPTRRLSVVNPDPQSSDEEDEVGSGGVYGGGEVEEGRGYASGKYVSNLERR
ncbi:hypothetical protein F5I97DRAFT_1836349 [Phlebopus sp. FC_14]|nr:hypothetical protein F5I97DRAFT_1836349 [Phlebopus sp. FC_14]